MMLEILTSIKLIKLYAWEKSFAKNIASNSKPIQLKHRRASLYSLYSCYVFVGVRAKEQRVLEKSMFVNTMSVAFLPMVPVFASIATFVGHVLAGNDLHPAQVARKKRFPVLA